MAHANANANANNNGSPHPSTKAHILVDPRQQMANLAEVAPQSPMPIQRRFISPVIGELSEQYPHVTTYKIDIDEAGMIEDDSSETGIKEDD
ncbi:hypothetical protein GBA52_013296 [Prunus armeniaca]|nr:hypothetical protein GBA52_013296 [Prunus armeniaca]